MGYRYARQQGQPIGRYRCVHVRTCTVPCVCVCVYHITCPARGLRYNKQTVNVGLFAELSVSLRRFLFLDQMASYGSAAISIEKAAVRPSIALVAVIVVSLQVNVDTLIVARSVSAASSECVSAAIVVVEAVCVCAAITSCQFIA